MSLERWPIDQYLSTSTRSQWSMACGLKSGDVVLKLEDVTCSLCRLTMDSGEVNAIAAIQTPEECQPLLDRAVVVLQDFAGRDDMVDFVDAVNSRIQVLYDRIGQLRGLAGSR